MLIYRNIESGKCFIYLKDIDWESFLVITPLSHIKIIERHLFDDEFEGSDFMLLNKGLITNKQLKIYYDYLKTLEKASFETSAHIPKKRLNKKTEQNVSRMRPVYKADRKRTMKVIEIDEQVYTLLQKKAIPFKETSPNHVLRRLLGLEKKIFTENRANRIQVQSSKSKAPSANLAILCQRRILHEGQTLYLNYKERNFSKKYTAKISNGKLLYNGFYYSMSGLVAEILDKEGFGIPSRAFRGPEYWYTSDGVSIKQIWEQFLKTHGR